MNCPRCSHLVAPGNRFCGQCGAPVEAGPAGTPQGQAPPSAEQGYPPVGPPPMPPRQEQGDATGGVIPYKNPKALMAYYFGIFSLIPCLGLVSGIAAVVLGILGLKDYRKKPIIRGVVHAWIGIVLGGLVGLVQLVVIVLFITDPLFF